MPSGPAILGAVLTAAALTWLLRAVPFTVLAPLRGSDLVGFLGTRMPVGVMIILVAYTNRDLPLADIHTVIAALTALVVTAGLHCWRRNVVLSILSGTAVHVVLTTVHLGSVVAG